MWGGYVSSAPHRNRTTGSKGEGVMVLVRVWMHNTIQISHKAATENRRWVEGGKGLTDFIELYEYLKYVV